MESVSKIVLLSVLVVLMAGSLGCTALEPCGTGEREYCTEQGDCTCGEGCDDPSDCEEGEQCTKYRFDSSHGVCLAEDWLYEHGLLEGNAGMDDAGTSETAMSEVGTADTSMTDAGRADASTTDAGTADASTTDVVD